MDEVRIGNASVDFASLTIAGDAGTFSVEPKVLDVLRVLIQQQGEVVGRETLIDQVWGVGFGGDERLSRAISLLRKALGDGPGKAGYIETLPKRGYRLVAKVKIDELAMPVPDEPSTGNQAATTWYQSRTAKWFVAIAILAIASFLLLWFWMGPAQPSGSNTEKSDPAFLEASNDQASRKSIAVLPFADLSPASDQKYLADGLAEEILNAVTKFPDLRVIGQTSSFMFRDAKLSAGDVGAALNVKYVLTGSVRRQGEKVRVSAQLVQTGNRQVLWSKIYNESADDIFDLQENIARAIAGELDIALNISQSERLVPELTADREAYELFLQGRALSRRFGEENKEKAVELLTQATRLDPELAAAWVWLGRTKMLLAITSAPSEIHALVLESRSDVDRALTLDPDLAMGHYTKSLLQDYDLDFAGSLTSAERAYALDPNQPFLAIRRGYYHALIGDSEKAEQMMENGLRSDPTDAAGLLNLAAVKLSRGDRDATFKLMQRSADLGFLPAAGWLCLLKSLQIDASNARECWNALPDELRDRYAPVFDSREMWKLLGNAQFGNNAVARQKVVNLLDAHFQKPDARINTYLLGLYLGLDEPKRFMKNFVAHPYPINASALSLVWLRPEGANSLLQHPDFPAFAQRVGLVEAWQKYGWPERCRKKLGTDGSRGRFKCR